MIRYEKIFSFSLFLLTLLFGISSCQQDKPSTLIETTSESRPTVDPKISDLMASMNIYQFDRPIKAPEFSLPSVEGKRFSLKEFQGNVIMLSFWATW